MEFHGEGSAKTFSKQTQANLMVAIELDRVTSLRPRKLLKKPNNFMFFILFSDIFFENLPRPF